VPGALVIVHDGFLGGAASRREWQETLRGLGLLRVGVRCVPAVAAGRETARSTEALECARAIAARVE